jgi:glutathione-regulated potassium-efflux system protein KefB
MTTEVQSTELISALSLLGAAVVAVPLFKRLKLGSVLGYLAAGVAIGPFGLALFTDPASILSTAEIGVVLLLFVIGLEMKPSRLWSLRRQIFGLGIAQIALSGALLTGVAWLAGYAIEAAFIAAMGFTMTSTAIVLQLLEERGETHSQGGQRIVSILLLEDLAIVPLLAIVAVLAPIHPEESGQPRWLEILIALGTIAGLVAFARYLLNPIFKLLADSHAREVMTAAALLVVLGAAVLMDLAGLSMAMGAFVAGVLLSESSFRHQLEADIEPFRGLLLGLFFLTVGMSLDLGLVAQHWGAILVLLVAFIVAKAAAIYAVARLLKARHPEAVHRALLMAQGGEFAFVLFTAAAGSGIFGVELAAQLTAVVILSMAVTPLLSLAADRFGREPESQSLDGIDVADGLTGTVLIIGFGRFGQVVSQALLSRGTDVSIIDADTDMIRAAARFGFKIYYGDGTRLDVLRAAGATDAKIVAVCVDDREAADKIVAIVKAEFPLTKLLVRSFDRGHTLDLIQAGVDFEIRETFESAMRFGEAALLALGVSEDEARETLEAVRARDAERLQLQITGGLAAGRDLLKNQPQPTPLTPPKREARPLTEETAIVADSEENDPVPPG